MEVPFVDLKSQYRSIKTEVDRAIQSVLESGQFIGGKSVHDFESNLAAVYEVKHCIGVGNGTDAILVALKSLDVARGDEIITPAFGWISASEMISLAGGRPVFADIDANDFTLDPAQVEASITPRTKGVILVHLFGQAGHAHVIKNICKKHNLFLIEDCAQAHLTREHTLPVGKIGDAGTFSFYPTKNLGAYGDAGGIITDRSDLDRKMRLYANHGGLQEHIMEGINSRMDPLQAAVLNVKLAHLSRWTEQRIANAKLYDTLLSGLDQIKCPTARSDTRHTFHQYVIRTSRPRKLKDFLASHQIQTMIHYPTALHNLPAYRHLNHKKDDFPQASRCQEEVLSLPVSPELSPLQITYVCDKIKIFCSHELR